MSLEIDILLMPSLPSLVVNPPRLPDLGMGYLAAACKKAGFKVALFDWNYQADKDQLRKDIADLKPKSVGVKVFTKDVWAACQTIDILKEALGDVPVIIGGPHISAIEPEEIFLDLPDADYALRGEAEISLPMLLENIIDATDNLEGIPGLVYRKSDEVIINPQPLLVDDLDSLGLPQWDLMDPAGYDHPFNRAGRSAGVTGTINITRGCPDRCTFCCAYRVNGRKVRARSAESVLEEIELLYEKYGVRLLLISDTNFIFYRELVEQVCEGIIRRGYRLKFNSPTGPNIRILDTELLKLLKRAGCHFIGFGVESGSQQMHKRIKKSAPLELVKEKSRLIRNMGMEVFGYFMFGFFDETRKQMQETIDYAFSVPYAHRNFDVVFPLPGTVEYRYLLKRHQLERIDWASFKLQDSPYQVCELTYPQLFNLSRKASLRQKMQPRNIANLARELLVNKELRQRSLKRLKGLIR